MALTERLGPFSFGKDGDAFAEFLPESHKIRPRLISGAVNVSEEMQTGTIKWFDDKKGYGFIVPDDGSADVFLHKRDVTASGIKNAKEALTEERKVKYRCEDNPRGNGKKIARHVELV